MSSISGSESDDDIGDDGGKSAAVKESSRADSDSEAYHVEGIGRRHPRVFFRNADDELMSVYRTVVHCKKVLTHKFTLRIIYSRLVINVQLLYSIIL